MPPSANDADWRRMPALLTTMETSVQARAAFAMSSSLVTSSRTGMRRSFVMLAGSRAPPYTRGTGVEQGLRDRGAEAAIGAGNQGRCAFDLHG